MKKAKIWITAFICYLFLCITFVERACGLGSPITDDVNVIPLLKQNIPKDYKIHVRYIPRPEAVNDMCWVQLNIYYLEKSLSNLTKQFGNISSNKENISLLTHMMQNMRLEYTDKVFLEFKMREFDCHYKEDKLLTENYFDYVTDIFDTYRQHENEHLSDTCDSPPCPTTTREPTTVTTGSTIITGTIRTTACTAAANCTPDKQTSDESGVKDKMQFLYLLITIPLCGLVLLAMWKVRSRRRRSFPGNISNGRLQREEEVDSTSEEIEKLKTIQV
ncbi:kit ligand a isoform X1 [Lepisosteus oculatus]|uniref:Kit ligand n=1 Tax=Lepisosteus oculatus TaxID=7918 RepID=W5NHV0_LEPOC|nr:PREDICTED: kit ligand isoform X1 [Lepisosteus oculatus]